MAECCGQCKWFNPENGDPTLNQKLLHIWDLPIFQLSRSGGSLPPIYGNCRAEFTDQNGRFNVFDLGTFSSSDCEARDDNKELLFTPRV